MPRRTHRGGQAQLERLFEASNKTAAGFAKYHKLVVDKVEGKASCWLIAVLANIDGALVNHRHPKVRDRYLELCLRNRILLHLMHTFLIDKGDEDEVQPELAVVLKSMFTHLHDMPKKFNHGSTWTPTANRNGWMGATAFLALAECAAILAFELKLAHQAHHLTRSSHSAQDALRMTCGEKEHGKMSGCGPLNAG